MKTYYPVSKMLNCIDISNWSPQRVKDWLSGVCDDIEWLDFDKILEDNISGDKLLMLDSYDLEKLGATKVSVQEQILEAIECLRFYNSKISRETLQTLILRLACLARSLQRQLSTKINAADESGSTKQVVLSEEFKETTPSNRQRVSLETLASISSAVTIVKSITDILSRQPYSNHDEYRSMKSLLLALSIELTSTAQRDQFVERPNDIIERSSKALADYCEKIVYRTRDPLMIQPFQIETVRIKKDSTESDLGITIKPSLSSDRHIIDRISPLSPAKKTNKLHEGDEILQFNQNIVGWSVQNVRNLLETSMKMNDIIMMVKKRPHE